MRTTLKIHDMKCHPEPFAAVAAGEKTHEVRVHDRPFSIGDVLRLREYDPTPGPSVGEVRGYTGRGICAVITYISAGGEWGLPVGLCVLSIQPFPVQI